MEEPYTKRLRERAQWVTSTFAPYSDQELVSFFRENVDRWGGEFIHQDTIDEDVP